MCIIGPVSYQEGNFGEKEFGEKEIEFDNIDRLYVGQGRRMTITELKSMTISSLAECTISKQLPAVKENSSVKKKMFQSGTTLGLTLDTNSGTLSSLAKSDPHLKASLENHCGFDGEF